VDNPTSFPFLFKIDKQSVITGLDNIVLKLFLDEP